MNDASIEQEASETTLEKSSGEENLPQDSQTILKNTQEKIKTPDIEQRIQNQFNEEKWTRISVKDVSISRFKMLESILEAALEKQKKAELSKMSKDHLENYEPSLSARYFLGMLAMKENSPDNLHYLKSLLDQFQELSKWAVVIYLADKMMERGENRTILKAKAIALEKLGKMKEAIPVLEKLAHLDRKDPDIARKYADAVLEEDIDKAIQFYKRSAKVYAKNLQFDNLKLIWGKLIDLIPEDFIFYRKIERILRGHRQKDILADLYVQLVLYYIKKEDIDKIILLCKKILEYNPSYTRFKNELIKAYREKYKDHSLLEDFIRYSGLMNNRKNIINSVKSFETNIVFDKNNYVFHRAWDVGKIRDLNTTEIVIDFKHKPSHKMNIQMALKSLKPLTEEHFWVYQYEKPDEIKKLFNDNLDEFFKILIRSFDNKISISELKEELVDKYVPAASWSKWWIKARAAILKDNLIAISPERKDILELREVPISLSDNLIEKSQASQSIEEKILVALEALKDIPETIDALEYMHHFFKEGCKSLELEIQLQCLWVLEAIHEGIGGEEEVYDRKVFDELTKKVKTLPINEASKLALKLKHLEMKKRYIKMLKEYNPQWRKIYLEILFHLPIKIHKYLITEMTEDDKSIQELNNFFSKLRSNATENAEIFLWSFRGLIYGHWKIKNLPLAEQIMSFFRLTRMLSKIEPKGTKLKNIAKEMIIGEGKEETLRSIDQYASIYVRKIASLVKDVIFINDIEKEKFIESLANKYSDQFKEEEAEQKALLSIEDLIRKSEKSGGGIASQNAIERMKNEIEKILKEEMPTNSQEIGEAQQKGDLKENAEYKAAMEKQSILQSTVTKLESEVKEVIPIAGVSIPKDRITLGSKVKLNDQKTEDLFIYTIMDRWDADVDNGIISYISPLGQLLMGHKVGDVVKFGNGEKEQNLEVLGINPAINEKGMLY